MTDADTLTAQPGSMETWVRENIDDHANCTDSCKTMEVP